MLSAIATTICLHATVGTGTANNPDMLVRQRHESQCPNAAKYILIVLKTQSF